MKTLNNVKSEVKDGKLTLTADIIEKDFSQFLVRRITIGHVNPDKMSHVRHVQVSDEAIFLKLPATKFGVAIEIEDFVSIATAIEPKTSFAPVFKRQKNPLTIEIGSELKPDFQWQVSDEINSKADWKDIEGQKSATLEPSTVKSGQWVRCIASSEAGAMPSLPIQIK